MMSEYELRKLSRNVARELADIFKEDDELLDIINPPVCMNIEEAAEYLRIPVGTLYNKVSEIPHEKVGKRLVFTDRGLIRWIKRKTKK